MNYRIELLKPCNYKNYSEFLLKNEYSLLYHSLKYLEFIGKITSSEFKCIIAVDEFNVIKAVLPFMIFRNKKYGSVVNSLPFYGSNGGILSIENDYNLKKDLMLNFMDTMSAGDCISLTVISSPFENELNVYEEIIHYDFIDSRIGQITHLSGVNKNIEDDLLNSYHSKTRNTIRKAMKSGLIITESNEYFDFLHKTHLDNLETLRGIPKPKVFFDNLNSMFKYGEDFLIYNAIYNNEPVASLLLFYFNNTVEYYLPVIKEEYRELQPMSYIIYNAMIDAVNRGYKYWNWGGTWKSQDGVYNFKRRWNTSNQDYYYYTKIFDESVLKLNKDTLLKEYPYFYVLPFDKLIT